MTELETSYIGPQASDTEVVPHLRENPSDENEINDIYAGNEAPRQDKLLEFIEFLSSEMNETFSRSRFNN